MQCSTTVFAHPRRRERIRVKSIFFRCSSPGVPRALNVRLRARTRPSKGLRCPWMPFYSAEGETLTPATPAALLDCVPVMPAIAVGDTVNEASFLSRLATVACAAALLPTAAQAEPLLIRNQNPLLALYGLPSHCRHVCRTQAMVGWPVS